MKPAKNEYDYRALAAAYHASTGKKQKAIQDALRLGSQSEVSRLLKHAREQEWLSLQFDWPKNLADDAINDIQNMVVADSDELRMQLAALGARRKIGTRRKAGVKLESLLIVPGEREKNATERYATFGRDAARQLSPLIRNARRVAVAWGHTIASLVAGFGDEKPAPGAAFIPVCGEPLSETRVELSPSAVVERLSEIFGAKRSFSLRGLPARIPKVLENDADVVRKFLYISRAYSEVFGSDGQPGEIDNIDMLISGVGDARTSKSDAWYRELSKMESLDVRDELGEITAGNIGGVWLPRDRASEATVKKLNSRSLGIQMEHIEDCAERGQKGRGPGVVILAVEAAKAEIVLRSIGLVNHLIISDALALRLMTKDLKKMD